MTEGSKQGLAQRTGSGFRNGLRFFGYAFSRFTGDRCMERGAALTYTSLLAMVPLMAVSFAIFSAFPAFDKMKHSVQVYLFESFVPEIGKAIFSHVEQFTSKTGELTGIGVIFLGITSVMLLSSISNTFNSIWRVQETRAMVGRMLAYWAALTLTPLMFGASLSLSSYLFAIAQSTGVTEHIGITNLAGLLPLFMQIVGLSILYIVIPYYPVQPRDALFGGVVAGMLFELLKKGFGLYIAHFPTYQTVYGALAMIPIFLVWIYVAWGVVLLGAEITAALPEWRAGVRETRHGNIRPARKLVAALSVLRALLLASRDGGGIRSREMYRLAEIAPDVLIEATNVLLKDNYIAKGEGGLWLLGRDLDETSLADLNRAFGLVVETDDFRNIDDTHWGRRLAEKVETFNTSGADAMEISLKALLKPDEAEIIEFQKIQAEEAAEDEIIDRKSRWLSVLGLAWLTSS
jgi:membrane protein